MSSPAQRAEPDAQQGIQDFRRYVGRIERRSVLLLAALCAVTWFALPADRPIAIGIAFGGVFSLLKFRLNARALARLGRSVATPGGLVASRFVTYGLAAAVLAAAFLREGINPYATAAAMFLTNAVVVCDSFRRRDGAGREPTDE